MMIYRQIAQKYVSWHEMGDIKLPEEVYQLLLKIALTGGKFLD